MEPKTSEKKTLDTINIIFVVLGFFEITEIHNAQFAIISSKLNHQEDFPRDTPLHMPKLWHPRIVFEHRTLLINQSFQKFSSKFCKFRKKTHGTMPLPNLASKNFGGNANNKIITK